MAPWCQLQETLPCGLIFKPIQRNSFDDRIHIKQFNAYDGSKHN